MRTAFAVTAMTQFSEIFTAEANAAESPLVDFPYLVICELNGVQRAFYFTKLGPDGVAVYIAPDGPAGTITIAGKAAAVGGEWSGSCSGKTLATLRASGQTFYVQPQK
ncbi:MAG: hypothetical protein ACRC67_03990 [Inquilinus sp.]|uniref:hypothetical protein n=1 Tax=Inquilinus sp. TaxID=1932117 RepID=UPI003F3F0AAA